MTVIKNWDDVPVTLTAHDVALILGFCDRKVYTLLKKGEIPGKQVGVQWVIDKDVFRDYLKNAA